jgi:NAD(P)-dependent dehydrogenase (short-subunit alcohol dehydrogenase family)
VVAARKELRMRIESGRVAVVTGGASGIGFALAAAAAAHGMRVVLADVRADTLEAAAARLSGEGASVAAVVADVSRPDDIERVARAAFRLGRVQLVCSNAGIVRHGRAWEVPAADWERVMGVNFMATVHLVRSFMPRLLAAGEPAQLLVTGSMASVTARPGISPYVAAKHALLGLCESLNQELAAVTTEVGVTLLLPGKVSTGMSRADYPDAIEPDEVARIAFAAVAQRRRLIFTHADRIPEVEQRFAAIVADGRPSLRARRLVEDRVGQQVDRGIPEPLEHDRIRQRQAEHLLDERAEDDVREVDGPVEHQPDLRVGERPRDLRLDERLHLAPHQVERLGEERQAGRPAFQGGPPDVARDERVVLDELVERLPPGAGGDRRRLIEPHTADDLADLGHYRVLHRLSQLVLGLEVVHDGAGRHVGFLGHHPDGRALRAVLGVQAQRRLADPRPGGEVGRAEGKAGIRHGELNSKGVPTTEHPHCKQYKCIDLRTSAS